MNRSECRIETQGCKWKKKTEIEWACGREVWPPVMKMSTGVWLWISKFMIHGTSHETVQLWDYFIKPHSLRTNVRNSHFDKTNQCLNNAFKSMASPLSADIIWLESCHFYEQKGMKHLKQVLQVLLLESYYLLFSFYVY